uniref:Pectin acetylesterase n=1 Tax=Strigamia maritima TaxID=126957 RepID=T1JJQ7_STRMM
MGWSLAVVVVLVGILGSSAMAKKTDDELPTNEVNTKAESTRDSALSLNNCRGRRKQLLRRVFLNNRSISCNDGSPAGYYIRKSNGNRRWVIYLEGGWYCFDLQSCHNRWIRLRSLMTSRLWPEIRHGGGILSSDPKENPYLWNANHVLIPYCSSDAWSGAFYPKTPDQLAFLGSEIILEVFHQLVSYGILGAHKVYLVGSSAGGTGVMINLDRVAHAFHHWGSTAEVRGIADSGWFLDNEPFNPMPCTDTHTCKPTEAVKLGFKFWNGQLPESCRAQYASDEWWKCYFGYRVYPTMQSK